MDPTAPVWLYCERGTATGLYAEPANALSSLALLLAALSGLWLYRRLPYGRRSADHLLLLGLVALIGLGGALFHSFANQWSELADMVPILVFMLVYLVHALNRLLRVPPGLATLAAFAFAVATLAAATMTCGTHDAALQPAWAKGATACLNGSFGYLPALLMLVIVARWLKRRGNRAAGSLLAAGGLLAVALVFRTIDHLACGYLAVEGHVLGTHFIWHLLVAPTLLVLLRAAMHHQDLPPVQEILPPERRTPVS
jgi:hypothetical protein